MALQVIYYLVDFFKYLVGLDVLAFSHLKTWEAF